MNNSMEFHWNSEDLEVRTKSVERTLQPLIDHVTILMDKQPTNGKKGKSKRAEVLIAAVQQATHNFIIQGEAIARETPEAERDMMLVLASVTNTGEHLRQSSMHFSQQPFNSEKRVAMVTAARLLLADVTRLLIIADMVDVFQLLKALRLLRGDIDRISSAQNNHDLNSGLKDFNDDVAEVNDKAGSRQMDLKNEAQSDQMGAARSALKKNQAMLFTASKTFVKYPELVAARDNKDYVIKQVRHAIDDLSKVTMERGGDGGRWGESCGELAGAINHFEHAIIMDPRSYRDDKTRPMLEGLLEGVVEKSAVLADLPSTREERREGVVRECQWVRTALQNLLDEYLYLSQNPGSSQNLDEARDQTYGRTRALKKQLRRVIVDQVGDSFLDTDMPLLLMMEAAGDGDVERTNAYAGVFVEHSNKLVEVSGLVCSMSTNPSAIRMIRIASEQLRQMCPQVVLSAQVLAARPQSPEAQENAEVHKEAWLRQLLFLTEAVDGAIELDDFLAVSEHHILEDINQCVEAIQGSDGGMLDETSGRIRSRCGRVCGVVEGEMVSMKEGGLYVERVMQAVSVLRDQIIVEFTNKMNTSISQLNSNQAIDENSFVQVSNLVYEGVRNVRRAVLNNQSIGDFDSDAEDEAEFEKFSRNAALRKSRQEDMNYEEEDSDRAVMRQLPEEDMNKIQQQVQLFRLEKAKLDREMEKWDESGNDVIVIAKRMCLIMMQMTDFMRGQGPMKSTMDVIKAAKEISDEGNSLDKLCKQIAENCQDSVTKKDLMAYLERIALHCHQLNITSKVKADVQNIGGELIVSGLESATSLIVAAKNLMNAVVLAVRSSYVASTKYPQVAAKSNVSWKMRVPEKKPLVQRENIEGMRARVKRGDSNRAIEPIKALSEFHA